MDQDDIRTQRQKFLDKRQKALDAAMETPPDDGSDRTEFRSAINQPPAVRATDGKPPGTKHENPLELAEKLESDDVDAKAVKVGKKTDK